MYHNIVLIGMMGSGKSTIGHRLAAESGFLFIDTDVLIEARIQCRISDFFEKNGEAAFRKIESEICATLPSYRGHVIATGGGIILAKANRDILKKTGWVVYLEASTGQIMTRLAQDQTRPLLQAPDKETRIQTLLTERDALYRSTAEVVVETTAPPDYIANALWQTYQRICGPCEAPPLAPPQGGESYI
jgi:shikimate kinase